MRLPSAIGTLAALVFAGITQAAAADSTAVGTVLVNVQVSSRTSLHVSSELLQFSVSDGIGVATAAVEFSAGARVDGRSDVVLTIEPLRAVDGPGGAADTDRSIDFSGEGSGTRAGTLTAGPSVAGRWHGSGRREGRILFTLHAPASGAYVVPVRFVLSTP